ncbi:MAG: hypothetical protein EOP04_25135 [Proteobacteria bacterium]|nr:MAG: hypothetical protein EOP04_25135 [Pseudomonadota bacterium]
MCTSVTKLEWDYVQYPLKHQSSEKESEKMDKPYLGSLPNLPYVSLFDTERRDFSLKTKGLVEELLNAFHASATSAFSEERLEDAALNCVKFLSGAKSLTDRCEGRIYEIFLNGKKLSVRRDAVQIELDLGASPFSKSSDEEDLG